MDAINRNPTLFFIYPKGTSYIISALYRKGSNMINLRTELQFIIHESEELLKRISQTMAELPDDDVYFQKKNTHGYYWDAAKNANGKHYFLGRADHPEVAKRLKYQVCQILDCRLQDLLHALNNIIDTIPLTIDLNDLEGELPEKYREFPRSLFQDLQMADQRSFQIQTENTFLGYQKWLRHETLSGLLVRSKSEQIIADRLYINEIHFEYEPSLPDDTGPEMHPDFRLFYPQENRWIYLEHVGMVGDKDYMESFKRKLAHYIDQGLLIGQDLFFTYDRPDGSIDLHTLNSVIEMVKKS